MGFQLLHKAVFVLYFGLNRAEIVEKHCVNKKQKSLKCDGKCHLKKYMAYEEQPTEKEGSSIPKIANDNFWNFIMPPFVQIIGSENFSIVSGCLNKNGVQFYSKFRHRAKISDIFQPPALS